MNNPRTEYILSAAKTVTCAQNSYTFAKRECNSAEAVYNKKKLTFNLAEDALTRALKTLENATS